MILCRAINRRSYAGRNGVFQINYSIEQGKVYVSSTIDSEKVILNDNLSDVLGFKHNIINGRCAGTTSGMDHIVFTDTPSGFSSESSIFLYNLFVETLRVGNSNVPLQSFHERKNSQDHTRHYNIKHLHYFPVTAFDLELCQLTLRTKLGDPLAKIKGFAVTSCYFSSHSIGRCLIEEKH